jgi:hypothetical protein
MTVRLGGGLAGPLITGKATPESHSPALAGRTRSLRCGHSAAFQEIESGGMQWHEIPLGMSRNESAHRGLGKALRG